MQKYAFAALMAVASTSAYAQSTGHTSYYGKELAGRKTASGERFNPGGLTAAHRTLAFGTRLKLTNPGNGRSVVVRVNDRGPFVRGRVLDVSLGAAQALGFAGQGVARLRIEPAGTALTKLDPKSLGQPDRIIPAVAEQADAADDAPLPPADGIISLVDRAISNK